MTMQHYGSPAFFRAVWALSETPTTAAEARAQLATLDEIDRAQLGPDRCCFAPRHYSKRRARLVHMYWALRRKGVTA